MLTNYISGQPLPVTEHIVYNFGINSMGYSTLWNVIVEPNDKSTVCSQTAQGWNFSCAAYLLCNPGGSVSSQVKKLPTTPGPHED